MTQKKEIVILPSSTFEIADLVKYREFFYYLVWRDVKVKYKQTFIGILWVVLQPFLAMIVFTFLFGSVARIPTDNIPYPIFMYTGLLYWNLFSRSVTTASESLISNQNLIKKVYFPKLIFPIASVCVNVVDFFSASIVLIILMIYFRYIPNFWGLLLVPVTVGSVLLLSIGIGSILALLNIRYRDVRFVVSYALQMLLFLTPVVYPENILAQKYRPLFVLNPLAGIIGFSRSTILHLDNFDALFFVSACLISALVFVFGMIYFRQQSSQISDMI